LLHSTTPDILEQELEQVYRLLAAAHKDLSLDELHKGQLQAVGQCGDQQGL
jgi:hypothetical protein